jgi:hypothetical protein
MNLRALAAFLLTMTCASSGYADDGPCGFRLWLRPWLRTADCPRLCGLPDDYCRKPCPPLTPVSRCGGPDDYCRKPMPCILGVSHCGGLDDYCRKSIPCLLCPPALPHLNHTSGSPCCAPSKHR